MKIDKILVPVDFSKHSVAAMELAKQYAEAFDAEVQLIHVFSDVIALAPPYGPPVPTNFGMKIERSAAEHFEKWRKEHCPSDMKVTVRIRRGDPSSQIVELAQEAGVDLIIMGTRGLTGLRHVVLGSVAERTVRHAPCPVVTTKFHAVSDE
jgi:universal stress protein A